MSIDWTEEKTKKLKEMYDEGIPRYGMSLILRCSEAAIKTGERYALHNLGLQKNTFVGMVRKEDIPKEFKIVF